MKTIKCLDCGIDVEHAYGPQKRCKTCALVSRKRQTAGYRAKASEHRSVAQHHYYIFKDGGRRCKVYKGMPFFDNWNPDKGGNIRAGADWIIKHLGKRPKNHSLHIIPSGKGFVPGNLVWADKTVQSDEKKHKIIAHQKHQIALLTSIVADNPFTDSEGAYYKLNIRTVSRSRFSQ